MVLKKQKSRALARLVAVWLVQAAVIALAPQERSIGVGE